MVHMSPTSKAKGNDWKTRFLDVINHYRTYPRYVPSFNRGLTRAGASASVRARQLIGSRELSTGPHERDNFFIFREEKVCKEHCIALQRSMFIREA